MINPEEVKQLAELARLSLSPDEIKRMSRDETDILDYVDRLRDLSLEHIALVDDRHRGDLRPDKPVAFESTDVLLKSFSDCRERLLKVPFVFSNQSDG